MHQQVSLSPQKRSWSRNQSIISTSYNAQRQNNNKFSINHCKINILNCFAQNNITYSRDV